MAGSDRSSVRTDLVRLGIGDVSAAMDTLDELAESLSVDRGTLTEDLGRAADPDGALRAVARIARRRPEVVQRVMADALERPALWSLLGASEGYGDFYFRHPEEIDNLAGARGGLPSLDLMRAELLASVGDEGGFAAAGDESAWVALRVAYRRIVARIAVYDLSSTDAEAVLAPVAAALADAAAAALEASLSVARTRISKGRPGGLFPREQVAATRLAIIGMGKTGARELNYVSDVDVIFVCGADDSVLEEIGESRVIDIATRLAAQTMQGIAGVEIEPPLWEVDANLRPEGKQGALVRTLDSHLSYYARWAKSWEFQALLKARALAGDLELGEQYVAAVQPKIWTSAARENFVDSVQRMRERVTDNIPAAELASQIKLGPGGIRDIEFTVQLLQLVHGLTDDRIRQRGTLDAIDALVAEGYIGRAEAAVFARDYRVLRVLEHRMQLRGLRRTHLMPERPDDRRVLARASGLATTGQQIWELWEAVKREVRDVHVRLFYRPLLSAVAALPEGERSLSTG
jgi:glutamate-ammonia-ligase adenylyltransferase